MPVSAVYGLPGKGKSLFICQYALSISNKYKKPIVTNFQFSPNWLAYLSKMMLLDWVLANLDSGIIYYINPNFGFQDMLVVPDSIVVIDEVALYAPRKDGGTPRAIRDALSMSRKLSQYILFSCQYPGQIDEGLKDYVDDVFYCNGTTVWSEKLRNEALIMKNCKRFTQENFKVWFGDPKLKRNPVKTRILSNKTWQGILNCIDAVTFNAYASFVDFRKMSTTLPLIDASVGDYPYCFLQNSRKHRLDYFPEEIKISPSLYQENLESLYRSEVQDEEDTIDIYSQIQSGQTFYSPYSKKPSKKQLDSESINSPRILLVWRIWGNNKIKLYKHSKIMNKIYSNFPAASLPGLMKIDKYFTKLSYSENDRLILKFFIGIFLFLLFPHFLRFIGIK